MYFNDLISVVMNNRHLVCCKLFYRDVPSCSDATSNADFIVTYADNSTLGTLEKTEYDIRAISWFDKTWP